MTEEILILSISSLVIALICLLSFALYLSNRDIRRTNEEISKFENRLNHGQ